MATKRKRRIVGVCLMAAGLEILTLFLAATTGPRMTAHILLTTHLFVWGLVSMFSLMSVGFYMVMTDSATGTEGR
jgi:hypothetical protein